MATITKDRKTQIAQEFGGTDKNTGSASVQVALLTERINSLSGHMQTHKKDIHSRRGLLMMVARRAHLLKYLSRTDITGYRALTEKLNIRQKH